MSLKLEDILAKICHDLASPVGAIANSIELYDDNPSDAATCEAALQGVRTQAQAASAVLRFFRLALASDLTDMLASHDMITLLQEPALQGKAQFIWHNLPPQLSGAQIRLCMLSARVGKEDLPRGGTVTLNWHTNGGLHMVLQGTHLRQNTGEATISRQVLLDLWQQSVAQLGYTVRVQTENGTREYYITA